MFQNCRGLPSPGLAKAPGSQMLRMTSLCWGDRPQPTQMQWPDAMGGSPSSGGC